MDQLGYGNLLTWTVQEGSTAKEPWNSGYASGRTLASWTVQEQRKGEEPRCARAAWRSAQPIPWLSRRKSRLVSSLG